MAECLFFTPQKLPDFAFVVHQKSEEKYNAVQVIIFEVKPGKTQTEDRQLFSDVLFFTVNNRSALVRVAWEYMQRKLSGSVLLHNKTICLYFQTLNCIGTMLVTRHNLYYIPLYTDTA